METFIPILTSCSRWLGRFLQVQCVVTATSLPFLAWWGLPVSIATFIGNLIFMPLLFAFLFISSCIFFLELVHIPSYPLPFILEQITHSWTYLGSLSSSAWLYGMPQVLTPILCLLPVIMIGGILYKKTIIALLISILILSTSLHVVSQEPRIVYIPCKTKSMAAVYNQGEITLIDNGATRKISNAHSWIIHTLLPTLNKAFGTSNICRYITMSPGKRTSNVVKILSENTNFRGIVHVTSNNFTRYC